MNENTLVPGKQQWKENRLIPTQKILDTFEAQQKFIDLLIENEGFLTLSAKSFGCSLRTIERRMVEYPDFADAVRTVKKHYDQALQEELEAISYEHARKPASVTQRIFLLNSLDPGRYRPKPVAPAPQALNITWGFRIPNLPGLREVPANAEVVDPEPVKPPRKVSPAAPTPNPEDEFSVGDIEL